MPDRLDTFLTGAGRRLEISSSTYGATVEHRGELGRAREFAFANALRDVLPRRYTVGTGLIIGANQTHSSQQDVVIFDNDNFPVFTYEGGVMVVPESLFASVSVKSRLRVREFTAYAEDAKNLKELVDEACPGRGVPLHGVVGYRTDGDWQSILDSYVGHVETTDERRRIDFVCDLGGHLCLDASTFGDPSRLPVSIRGRSHVMGMRHKACAIEVRDLAFPDLYKVLLHALPLQELGSESTHTVSSPVAIEPASAPTTPRPYHASFSGKSVDLTLAPGQVGQLSAIYFNDGTESWEPGKVFLAVAEPPDPEGWRSQREWAAGWYSAQYYATVSATVPPGWNGFVTYNVLVPANARPGTYRFYARLETWDGRTMSDVKWAHTVYVK